MGKDFNNTQAIWIQIVEWVFEQVLTGVWKADEKVKSVRELAVDFEVNPNTVMHSYDYLQTNDIIYNKRGLGFFVTPGADVKIKEIRKKKFMEEDVPIFLKTMKMLGIEWREIEAMMQ